MAGHTLQRLERSAGKGRRRGNTRCEAQPDEEWEAKVRGSTQEEEDEDHDDDDDDEDDDEGGFISPYQGCMGISLHS